MWMRKTLDAAVTRAVADVAEAADGRLEIGAEHLAAVLDPVRQDLADAAWTVTMGALFLGAAILLAGVMVTSGR